MAGCSNNNRRGLTESKLEVEAHWLMEIELDIDSELLDQASEYNGHQTDTEEEFNDIGKGRVYSYKTKSSSEALDEGSYYSTLETSFTLKTGVIKYEEGKCGEQSLIVSIPRYTYFLSHVVFFLLGVCHILPYTFFAAANNFWLHKFRNISDPSESAENRTLLQKNFASSTIVVGTILNLASGIFNVTLGHRYKIKNRLIATLCIELLIFILFTISVKVDIDSYQAPFFVIILIGLGILAAANTVNVTASQILYPRFPPTYMKICMAGQGSGGLLGDILNIVIVTYFRGDIIKATLLYFSFGTVTVATTLILSIVISRTIFFQNYLGSIPQNTEMEIPSRKELMRIGYKILYPLVLVAVFITGESATHPAITALVVSEEASSSSSWANHYFSPLVSFLLADSALLIGRLISSYVPFNISNTTFLLISVARTLVLVPFIWLCNAQPRNRLPVLFSHDYQYGIILGLFMITNGYIVNKAILIIQVKVDKHESDVAYSLFGLIVNIIQALTSPIGLFIVNIL